jgi:hypothetical protein
MEDIHYTTLDSFTMVTLQPSSCKLRKRRVAQAAFLLFSTAACLAPSTVVSFAPIQTRTGDIRSKRPWIAVAVTNGDIESNRRDKVDHDIVTMAQILDLDKIEVLLNKTAAQAVDVFANITASNNSVRENPEHIPAPVLPPPSPVCRIVTRAGSRLPSDVAVLPSSLFQEPHHIMDKLQAYYHAQARQKNSLYDASQETIEKEQDNYYYNDSRQSPAKTPSKQRGQDAPQVPSVLRQSLEDAAYEWLNRRDIDLCEALNAGYLLRLSILPDVSQLDPGIAQEFYPELFDTDGNFRTDSHVKELLFDGRVLVYWRGYSQEVTRGRLLLPKIDYLQASLVQRSAAWVNQKLAKVEGRLLRNILAQTRKLRKKIVKLQRTIVKKMKMREIAGKVQGSLGHAGDSSVQGNVMDSIFGNDDGQENEDEDNTDDMASNKRKGSIRLGRYGGSKIRFVGNPDPSDALEPFTICEYNYDDDGDHETSGIVYTNGTSSIPPKPRRKLKKQSSNATVSICEHDMYDEINHNCFTCEYDARAMADGRMDRLPKMQLLERVTISNLVDLFTKEGRREVLRALFSKSKLVEPTYEEIVVIWRPLIKEKKKKQAPPKFVSEFADMFDIEGFEQPKPEEIQVPKGKLEIRTFEQVPMSNLPAVLPKTKLVFRPADAFLFDLISVITLSLVLSSVRFDSTRLDVLALASVSFWVFRTVIRYSNKLARYDLLVKTFLTSKISQRNAGAFKYLTYEAGSQRAIRAALVHSWILRYLQSGLSAAVTRDDLEQNCVTEVNKLLNTNKEVQLDPKRAIQDLEDLRLVRFSENDGLIPEALTYADSTDIIKQLWEELLDNQTTVANIVSDGTEDDAVKLPQSRQSLYDIPSPLSPTIKSKDI